MSAPEILCTPHPRGPEIARTIRDQIGLDAWLAVSARQPRWWTNSTGDVVFAFRFGSRYGLAKWIEITYQQASDDYDIVAYKIRRNGLRETMSLPDAVTGREQSEWEGVYADALPRFVRRANLFADLS